MITIAGVAVFFVNLFWSLAAGKKAPDNPWGEGATTLEWTLSEPAAVPPIFDPAEDRLGAGVAVQRGAPRLLQPGRFSAPLAAKSRTWRHRDPTDHLERRVDDARRDNSGAGLRAARPARRPVTGRWYTSAVNRRTTLP